MNIMLIISIQTIKIHVVASELKDPIWHSSEWQIGSFSSEATMYILYFFQYQDISATSTNTFFLKQLLGMTSIFVFNSVLK